MDSFRFNLTNIIDIDLTLTDSLRTKAKFRSNRNFFSSFNNYLNHYYKSYTDPKTINDILKNAKKQKLLKLDNGEYIMLYQIDLLAYSSTKIPYLNIKAEFEKREQKANLLMKYMLFPLKIILN